MPRLFFALWPDAAVCEALAQQATQAAAAWPGARAVRAENLHLTLAFLGAVPAQRLNDVLTAAKYVRTEAFSFTLRRLVHWAKADVLCATPADASPSLARLAAQLRDALHAQAVTADDRPYRPHVTLCRKARGSRAEFPAVPDMSIEWRAREFVLAESADDAGRSIYRIAARWPLLPPP